MVSFTIVIATVAALTGQVLGQPDSMPMPSTCNTGETYCGFHLLNNGNSMFPFLAMAPPGAGKQPLRPPSPPREQKLTNPIKKKQPSSSGPRRFARPSPAWRRAAAPRPSTDARRASTSSSTSTTARAPARGASPTAAACADPPPPSPTTAALLAKLRGAENGGTLRC